MAQAFSTERARRQRVPRLHANGVSIGKPGVVSSFGNLPWSGTVCERGHRGRLLDPRRHGFRWDPLDKQWIFNINNKSYRRTQTYISNNKLNEDRDIILIPV